MFNLRAFVCSFIIVAKTTSGAVVKWFDRDDEAKDKIANRIEGWFKQLQILNKSEDSLMCTRLRACRVEAHCDICGCLPAHVQLEYQSSD